MTCRSAGPTYRNDLTREIVEHEAWHLERMHQEQAQRPDRRQLQREPETVVLPAVPRDQRPIGVIKEEHVLQFRPRWRPTEPPIRSRLLVTQKLDRHRRTRYGRSAPEAAAQLLS